MSDLRVLVVGASIAGPTTAYWLAKAGAQVTVIERFPHLRTDGQGIDIRSAGVTVMQKMPGMEEAVRANLNPLQGFSIADQKGRPFATMRATGNADQQSLVSEYEIFRGDLARIIVDLTKDNKNIKYVYGEQVVSMLQKEDVSGPVTVDFANGYPTTEYDLVVACDGATSRTRAIGLNCGVRDHIVPLNTYGVFCTIDEDLRNGSLMGQGWSTVGGRCVFIGPTRTGKDQTTATFFKIHPRDGTDATLPFREAAKRGTPALQEFVAEQFGGLGWKTPEIVQGMLQSTEFYASELVQVKVPSLHKGRFVLVGDAGYAAGPTGGGTSMALAGAYLLAGEVCRHKGDLAAGLQAYEERMKPIIKDLQAIPPGFPGIMAPQTAWRISLRNWVFYLACWGMELGSSPALSWIGSLVAKWSPAFGGDKFGLPEYEWVA